MSLSLDLLKLSDEELFRLNSEICAILKARSRHENLAKLRTLSPGDSVSFKNPEGGRIHGTVIRVNQKSITIATERGQWRVAPCFVTKDDSAAKTKGGQLFELKRPSAQ
jgi:hypothetical protein